MKTINELKDKVDDVRKLKDFIKHNSERVSSIKGDGYKFIKHQRRMCFHVNYYKRMKERQQSSNESN